VRQVFLEEGYALFGAIIISLMKDWFPLGWILAPTEAAFHEVLIDEYHNCPRLNRWEVC
jgi:hypothetical protein